MKYWNAYTFAEKYTENVFKNGYNGYKNMDMLYLSNGAR